MGAGWAAVAAAAAARAGRETGEVIAEAQQVGDATRVLALIEYPPRSPGSAAGSPARCGAAAPSSSCAAPRSRSSGARADARRD